jgi:ABC-type sugar transport system substrate-binding protein
MSRTRSLRAGIVAGLAGLALTLTACAGSAGGSSATGTAGSAGPGGLKGKTIALVGYGSANPWGAAFNSEFKSRLSASGVTIRDLTTMDPGTQVQNFNQAVAEKPNLIVLAVLDTKAMVVPIEKAKQAGIPVLAFDGPTDPSVAGDVMSVLSNNEQLGEFAAQNLI